MSTSRIAFSVAMLALALPATVATADFDSPAPKVDCTKQKNKNKPACQPHRKDEAQDEIYNAAYWMNRSGHYAEALAILKRAPEGDDPRVLNETGFATRQLGDASTALGYYKRALTIDPNYVYARAYMGEALLLQGDRDAASDQLREIGQRCGTTCPAYGHLAEHIAEYDASHHGS